MNDRDLRRKAELAELLLHAARQLGESLEPHVVYERFHELLAVVVPHDGIVISSYDDRDDLIRCEYAWSDGGSRPREAPAAAAESRRRRHAEPRDRQR